MTYETDPLSAAHTYRQTLEAIAKAPSLASAVRHAQQALNITFRGPTGGDISVVGRFGANTQQAYVALTVPDLVNQIPANDARKIAADILTEAAIAEQDGALVAWLVADGATAGQIGRLMSALRRFRGQSRGDVSDEERRADEPTSAA